MAESRREQLMRLRSEQGGASPASAVVGRTDATPLMSARRDLLTRLRAEQGAIPKVAPPAPVGPVEPSMAAPEPQPRSFLERVDKGVSRPIERLGPAIMEEAHAGRMQAQRALTEPLQPYRGLGSRAVELGARGANVLIGAGRLAFPIAGGAATALAEEPVSRTTGSPVFGAIAGAALPLGGLGFSRIPAAASKIAKLSPVARLGLLEAGIDAPLKGAAGAPIGASGGTSGAEASKGGLKLAPSFDDLTEGHEISSHGRKKLADIAINKVGLTLTKGERSGSRKRQIFETGHELLPFGGLQDVREGNKTALSNYLTGRIGRSSEELDPKWLNETREAIGSRFDELSAKAGDIDLNKFLTDSQKHLPGKIQSADRKSFESLLRTIRDQYGERINPQQYQEIQSQLKTLAREKAVKKPDLARRYGMLSDELDGAVENTLGGETKAAWKDVRSKYREYLVLESSVDAEGKIDPAKLARQIEQSYKKGVRIPIGDNDLYDVARMIRVFKNQIPSSGTAERTSSLAALQSARTTAGVLSLGKAAAVGKVAKMYSLAGGRPQKLPKKK